MEKVEEREEVKKRKEGKARVYKEKGEGKKRM